MGKQDNGQDMGQVVGTIKWYNRDKGYGFARLDDGREAFLHHSALRDGRTDLNDGEPITARLVSTTRGLALREVYVRV